MKKLGGGERRALDKSLRLARDGGGLEDHFAYIRKMDIRDTDDLKFKVPISHIAKRLGLAKGMFKPMPLSVVRHSIRHNTRAHPGPTLGNCGFLKKGEALPCIWDLAEHIVERAAVQPIVGEYSVRYAMAGRTKLKDKEKTAEKLRDGEPIGRPVDMADAWEAPIVSMFLVPIYEKLMEEMSVICIGFNKFSDHPTRLARELEKCDAYINGDIKMFDKSARAKLMERVIDLIRYVHDIPRTDDCQHSRLLDWIEDEYIHGRLVLPTGRSVITNGCVSSGTGLTIFGDSIMVAIAWLEFEYHSKKKITCLKVQGDDSLVGLCFGGRKRDNQTRADKYLARAAEFFRDKMYLRLDPDKSLAVTDLYVGYLQPKLPQEVRNGSYEVQRAYREGLRRAVGRPLRLEEEFDILDDEPIGPAPGMTHRWVYHFKNRVTFLSYYFKLDRSETGGGNVMMVRPTQEVIDRLVNPEYPVRDIDHHLERLSNALVENMGNHHVANRVMHYVYDAWVLKNECSIHSKRSIRLYDRRSDKQYLRTGSYEDRRAWYRRIEEQVDLLDVDPAFAKFWNTFMTRASRVYSSQYGSRYTNWSTIRALRKGHVMPGLTCSLTRMPEQVDLTYIADTPNVLRDTYPLGFGLYQNRSARETILRFLIKILQRPDFSNKDADVYELREYIYGLRKYYSSALQ
jgi:hypothetical protein